MKKILSIFVITLALFFWGCEDYSAEEPAIQSIELQGQTEGEEGAVIASFMFECDAEHVVVWWGYAGSQYSAYQDSINATPYSDPTKVTSDFPTGENML